MRCCPVRVPQWRFCAAMPAWRHDAGTVPRCRFGDAMPVRRRTGRRETSRSLRHSRLFSFLLIVGLTACTTAEQESDTGGAVASGEAVGPTPAPEDAVSYFISPTDGDVVSDSVTVRFGLRGMGVAPAGVQVNNTGHHHLLVDVETLPDLTQPMPSDASHIHFGGGQTETVLVLEPGTHTLQLVLGDHVHRPHDPPVMSERITITVE